MANLSRLYPREFNSWANMKQRCNNPKHPRFQDWGGRGIAVCHSWGSFSNFLSDMGPCPKKSSLNRKDNDGGYSPENCEWADATSQSLNQRLRKDNSLGQRGISSTGYSYRVNLQRRGKRYTSLSIPKMEDAIELRDFLLEVLDDQKTTTLS